MECSSCGHTWFQHHPDGPGEAGQGAGDSGARSGPGSPGPDIAGDAAPMPRARTLDPEVAEVLRAEREHETRQRAAEAAAIESQPELGLAPPDAADRARHARQARAEMVRDSGAAGPAAAAATARRPTRRDRLPDAQEINQTLRAAGEPRVVDQVDRRPPPDEAERRGFARGFVLVLLVMALAVAVYVSATDIALAVPAAAGALETYVVGVDAMRAWLDIQLDAAADLINAASPEPAGPAE